VRRTVWGESLSGILQEIAEVMNETRSALTIAISGAVSEPKPETAIMLLSLLVATIISLPYQKWRKPAVDAAPYTEARHPN
jgi:hypothetical protein